MLCRAASVRRLGLFLGLDRRRSRRPRTAGQQAAGTPRPHGSVGHREGRARPGRPHGISEISLETLRAHYIAAGDIERARWAEDELLQFHRITKQAFRLDLDVPPPTLQASYNIPEANELYSRR